jgi:hypothetical protein
MTSPEDQVGAARKAKLVCDNSRKSKEAGGWWHEAAEAPREQQEVSHKVNKVMLPCIRLTNKRLLGL